MRKNHENPLAYGGSLLKTRRGRAKPRPIATGQTMHLVLRSTKAAGPWSFRTPRNFSTIQKILKKFASKHGVGIESFAINLNHLHLHVKISTRHAYMRFIRAISSAIAMAVTGMSRWNPLELKFWDRRPFSRVVVGERDRENMRDYIRINELEGGGCKRVEARFYMDLEKADRADRIRWRRI
jgi:REP element-mobilizing transposase RayT